MRHLIMLAPLPIVATMLGVALAAPKDFGQMRRGECRDEVHKLYRDDLPYASTIKSLIEAADAAWPTLSQEKQDESEARVYERLMYALRLLRPDFQMRGDMASRKDEAALYISYAIDASHLSAKYHDFYKDVFQSDGFKSRTPPSRRRSLTSGRATSVPKSPCPTASCCS